MSAPGGRARGIREIAPRVWEVTSEPRPLGPLGSGWRRLRRLLLGEPLPSWLERQERLGVLAAIALIGADLVSSSVYGPEEMLRTLGQAGPAATALALPIGLAIVALLAILTTSYRQTIGAYPGGAGGYIVAKDNLGPLFGLIGAAALLIDYCLDVAVSIASGVQSLTSAVPSLASLRVELCLLALAILSVVNLRGVRAAGLIFSAPVHLYLAGTLAVLALGIFEWSWGTLPPYTPPPSAASELAQATGAIGLVLLLRAFSSGAVALTGIEAISNGVPYFRPPETKSAKRALTVLALVFGAVFIGIAFLAGRLGIVADPEEIETVLSQVTRTVVGRGPPYLVLQALTVLMLVLAANTGFADFPRLLALLAKDRYLPDTFAARGSRLSFSHGILLVTAMAAVLLIVFKGSVAGLVPLFTVGAFVTFSLSQAGMVRHWWRHGERGWGWRMAANGVGAATTSVVLVVVLASKFVHGAWIVALALPLLVWGLHVVGRHNDRLAKRVRIRIEAAPRWTRALAARTHHRVLVPVDAIDKVTLNAVASLMSLFGLDAPHGDAVRPRPSIELVHVTDDRDAGGRLQAEWRATGIPIPLTVLVSPYRATTDTLVRYADLLAHSDDGRSLVTIVLPETRPTRWWHPFLRNYLAWHLKWALLFRPKVSVFSVPLDVRD